MKDGSFRSHVMRDKQVFVLFVVVPFVGYLLSVFPPDWLPFGKSWLYRDVPGPLLGAISLLVMLGSWAEWKREAGEGTKERE